jgi:hypothetical protein
MIPKGTPQGTYGRNVDPPEEYVGLDAGVRGVLLWWIHHSIQPTKVKVSRQSSYSLKHHFERDTGLYVSNGQFKGAMLEVSYEPVDTKERNWRFRITRRKVARAARGGRAA